MTTLQDTLSELEGHKGRAAATKPTPNMSRVLCTMHITEPEVSSGTIGLSAPSSFLGFGGAGAGAGGLGAKISKGSSTLSTW